MGLRSRVCRLYPGGPGVVVILFLGKLPTGETVRVDWEDGNIRAVGGGIEQIFHQRARAYRRIGPIPCTWSDTPEGHIRDLRSFNVIIHDVLSDVEVINQAEMDRYMDMLYPPDPEEDDPYCVY
jgi:hypothetical protein